MKRAREDTENPSPAAKRPATQASPEVELALARQRIEFLEERARLEKRGLEEKAGLEKRALVAEHRAALLESEKRAALLEFEKRALVEKALLEKRALVAEHRATVLESKQKGEEKNEEPKQEARTVAGRASDEFPWLTVQVFSLPEDLLTHTATFLTDDDLFGLRGVSRTFYRAFYSQRNNIDSGRFISQFNSWRAFKLASKGRVFPKLEKLAFEHNKTLTSRNLAVLGPQHFPKLTDLNLYVQKHPPLWIMPSHPNLTCLEALLAPSHDDRITALRFPALKTLCVNVFHKEARVEGHPGLEVLDVCLLWTSEVSCEEIVESFDWSSISREAFPSLKTVVDENENVPEEVKVRLEAEGIEVTLERPC